MRTMGRSAPGASSVLTTNMASRPWFQEPIGSSTPHSGTAPSNCRGAASSRLPVTRPPSDAPQAMLRRGWPTWVTNCCTVASWSGTAESSAQPVLAYPEPANAYPWPSSAAPIAGLGDVSAGFELPNRYPWLHSNSVPFQLAGTSSRYFAPSGRVPSRVIGPVAAAAAGAVSATGNATGAARRVLAATAATMLSLLTAPPDDCEDRSGFSSPLAWVTSGTGGAQPLRARRPSRGGSCRPSPAAGSPDGQQPQTPYRQFTPTSVTRTIRVPLKVSRYTEW